MQKRKRIVNKALLESLRGTPCQACGKRYGSVAHHIKTVKTGGDDHPDNLLVLCQDHHTGPGGVHRTGLVHLVKNFLHLHDILLRKGWQFDQFSGRYIFMEGK